MYDMSGSLVLRSGVGTQMLIVSSSATTPKSVVARSVPAGDAGARRPRSGRPGCTTCPALIASIFRASRSMPVVVEAGAREFDRERQADVAEADDADRARCGRSRRSRSSAIIDMASQRVLQRRAPALPSSVCLTRRHRLFRRCVGRTNAVNAAGAAAASVGAAGGGQADAPAGSRGGRGRRRLRASAGGTARRARGAARRARARERPSPARAACSCCSRAASARARASSSTAALAVRRGGCCCTGPGRIRARAQPSRPRCANASAGSAGTTDAWPSRVRPRAEHAGRVEIGDHFVDRAAASISLRSSP